MCLCTDVSSDGALTVPPAGKPIVKLHSPSPTRSESSSKTLSGSPEVLSVASNGLSGVSLTGAPDVLDVTFKTPPGGDLTGAPDEVLKGPPDGAVSKPPALIPVPEHFAEQYSAFHVSENLIQCIERLRRDKDPKLHQLYVTVVVGNEKSIDFGADFISTKVFECEDPIADRAQAVARLQRLPPFYPAVGGEQSLKSVVGALLKNGMTPYHSVNYKDDVRMIIFKMK